MLPPDKYRNPYDFVRLEDKANTTIAPDFRRATNYSGVITYSLYTLTPVVVNEVPPSQSSGKFARLGKEHVIPATSLKGMFRSVYEVVTNSNMGMLKHNVGKNQSSYQMKDSKSSPTPAEALFGAARDNAAEGTGAGRILFRDITVPKLETIKIPRPLGGPRPGYKSFYFFTPPNSEEQRILGRKFYYHQRFEVNSNGVTVEAILQNTNLDGKLHFIDLTKEELEALVYTLVLEWDEQNEQGLLLAHKLGYGKPLGLGSVRIQIIRLEVEKSDTRETIPARFLSYGESTTEDWTDHVPSLRDAARASWLGRPQGKWSYKDFTIIARWQDTELFRYPDFAFFEKEKERNSQQKMPLWKYQRRTSPHPGGAAPTSPSTASSQSTPTSSSPTPPPSPHRGGATPPPSPHRGGAAPTSPSTPPSQSKQPGTPRGPKGMLMKKEDAYVVVDGTIELPASGGFITKNKERLAKGERISVRYRRKNIEGVDKATDLKEEQP